MHNTTPKSHLRQTASPSLWLMLALIIEQPCSGSDLIARYRKRFGLLAPRGLGDFSTIRRLEHLAYIEALPPGSPSRPPDTREASMCFTATPTGIAAHRRWLSCPIDEQRWRTELLARIATGGSLDPQHLLDLIERYGSHANADSDRAERLGTNEANPESLSTLAAGLALQEQQETLTAQRDWAERALRVIHEHAGIGDHHR